MPYFEKLQLKLFEEFEIGSMKMKIKDIEEMKTVIQDNNEKINEQKIELNETRARLEEQKLGEKLVCVLNLSGTQIVNLEADTINISFSQN